MNYFKQILRFAIPYKRYAVLNIFFNIFYALFSALAFVAFIPMLDVLFNENTTKVTKKPEYTSILELSSYLEDSLAYHVNYLAETNKMNALLLAVSLIITLFFLKNICNYLAMYFITFLRNGVLKDLRNSIFFKITHLPIAFFSEKRKGDTIARITGDVQEIQSSFLSILELIIREPLTILFTILIMFKISAQLTLFVFIFLPISGYIISLIGKSLKRKSDRVQKEQGQFLSIIEETLSGLKIIKGFNAQNTFNSKFQDSTHRFYQFSNTLLNRQNLASPTSEFLGIVVIGVILWFGGKMVLVDNILKGSEFIAYLGLAYNILTPAKAISKAVYSVKKGNAAAERVLEVLNTTSTLEDLPNALVKTDFNTEVSINNISFKYENDYVLDNFSFSVLKGKSVALVGQSGSGKSTIANLVTRFYDVNKGSITIDGVDIKTLTKASLRGLIGIVTQDAILFNDSVKNNILLGDQNASDKDVIEALKIANAWEFVNELPLGIETNIGDSGNKLSGGQKQRLSIARAVLKNPPIMILDEATSALDTESERLVQIALENMTKNRTTIAIAHRLSTIQNADEIIVMQKGRIVEQGRHQDLINRNGTYRKLVDMQSFE